MINPKGHENLRVDRAGDPALIREEFPLTDGNAADDLDGWGGVAAGRVKRSGPAPADYHDSKACSGNGPAP